MLSKPIPSGIMLVAIIAALGGAWWQQNAPVGTEIRTAGIEEAAPPEPVAEPDEDTAPEPVEEMLAPEPSVAESPAEPAAEAPEERTATAPARVVDSAGFPLVPEAAAEPETAAAPIVTINGRPLGTDAEAPAEVAALPEPEAPEPVAPRPIPRPPGLALPPAPAIDYEAITATAHDPGPGFITEEQRNRLAPIPAPAANGGFDPREQGLIEVIGDNGEVLWIYEEQVRDYYRGQGSRVVMPGNEFGFVYDENDW